MMIHRNRLNELDFILIKITQQRAYVRWNHHIEVNQKLVNYETVNSLN